MCTLDLFSLVFYWRLSASVVFLRPRTSSYAGQHRHGLRSNCDCILSDDMRNGMSDSAVVAVEPQVILTVVRRLVADWLAWRYVLCFYLTGSALCFVLCQKY